MFHTLTCIIELFTTYLNETPIPNSQVSEIFPDTIIHDSKNKPEVQNIKGNT